MTSFPARNNISLVFSGLSNSEPTARSSSGSGSVFLHVGQVHVSKKPQSIVLILGSCVAVCAWDPVSGIGGATHYLVPAWDGKGAPSARYGNVAISELLQKLVDAGAHREQLRAKVFGGGCLFEKPRNSSNKADLGAQNVEIAMAILLKERIIHDASLVRGSRGKRVVFSTNTGEAVVTDL
jgi:chemotaxis protein CheD